jgi:flagellin
MAQQNLNVDNQFQNQTIEQLTSGYRINASGDDAAGLAVANGYRSSITELNQGVRNANDGVSQLQIIDGGLSNISTILDRMKTLATQSASSTFTGSRATLNQEFSQLSAEIDRQASNVNLNSGGSFNNVLNVYIGGASSAANANVSVDLSGAASAIDSTSLGLGGTNVLDGGVSIGHNTQRLDAPGAAFVVGTAGTDDQTFTFNVFSNGQAQAVTATVAASAAGSSLTQVLSNLNGQLNKYGISASTASDGTLQFSGGNAFTLTDNSGTGTSLLTNTAGSVGTASQATNSANYDIEGGTFVTQTGNETLSFQTSAGATSVTLGTGLSISDSIAQINAKTSNLGVYAVLNSAGDGISFQSANSFSVNDVAHADAEGVFGTNGLAAGLNTASTAPSASAASNGTAAIAAINTAIAALGLVQGRVGAGENKLGYAISLAQSQISSYSAAESQIRDADVAAQAANLTKAQVLTQTSVAALAQANSAPQSILKLLQ